MSDGVIFENLFRKVAICFANSGNPDKISHSTASVQNRTQLLTNVYGMCMFAFLCIFAQPGWHCVSA